MRARESGREMVYSQKVKQDNRRRENSYQNTGPGNSGRRRQRGKRERKRQRGVGRQYREKETESGREARERERDREGQEAKRAKGRHVRKAGVKNECTQKGKGGREKTVSSSQLQ